MNYTVIWSLEAEAQLATVWVNAADRNEISVLTDLIDRSLGLNPFRVGRRRASSVNRTAIVSPLAIMFDIIEDDKKVIVQSCWLIS